MRGISRTRRTTTGFCRISGCQNLLFGQQAGFCSDACRIQYHTTARQVGHAVIDKTGYRQAQAIANSTVSVTIRQPRPEYVDLERMFPQERLGMLCRAAERWGVIKA